ncbi:MAG: serine/threonine-protein kinase [Acidianus infernus]|nr:serine/threonine-protein kinase [Acidianus infernus]
MPPLITFLIPIIYTILYPQLLQLDFSNPLTSIASDLELLIIFIGIIFAVLSGLALASDDESYSEGFLPFFIGLFVNGAQLYFALQGNQVNMYYILNLDPMFLTIATASYVLPRKQTTRNVTITIPTLSKSPTANTRNAKRTGQKMKSTPTTRNVTTTANVYFELQGLPPSCTPIIRINGYDKPVYYNNGKFLLKVDYSCSWEALPVNCNGEQYYPDKKRGLATIGYYVIIKYSKTVTPISLSQPSGSVNPTSAQPLPKVPDVWIGSTIGSYKIESLIGEGGTGYVLKGRFSNQEVAIKVLKIDKDPDLFANLAREAFNLAELSKHPNVVKIYAINVDKLVIDKILNGDTLLYVKSPPYIVMELMKGSIYDLMMKDEFFYSQAWRRTVIRAIKKIAEALYYMHSNGYVHMDVKPQNILIDKVPSEPAELDNVNFKLGDMGGAVRVGEKVIQFTPTYAPPEVFLYKAMPVFDVFSLGMTLYVLLTRKIDRPDLQEMNEAFNDLSKVKVARDKLNAWSQNLDEVIRKAILLQATVKDFMNLQY